MADLRSAGLRLAVAEGNTLAVFALDSYTGDAFVPQGYRTVAWEGNEPPEHIAWNPTLPRYVFFLSGSDLIAAEVGFYVERNAHVLASQVKNFMFDGYVVYVLKTDGSLFALSLE